MIALPGPGTPRWTSIAAAAPTAQARKAVPPERDDGNGTIEPAEQQLVGDDHGADRRHEDAEEVQPIEEEAPHAGDGEETPE